MKRQHDFLLILGRFIHKTCHLFLFPMSLYLVNSQSLAKSTDAQTLNIRNYSGRVIKCHDGDTCRILINNKSEKIRFSGIDAPELNQAGGQLAQKTLENLIVNRNVMLICEGFSFNRSTCVVFYNQKDINGEMVRLGLAWDYPKFSKGKYQNLMIEAQMKKRGLWKTAKKITSPYCFRHKSLHKCKSSPSYMEQ